MAKKTLFGGSHNRLPAANAVNEAGGTAYRMSAKQALAQYAATGCLNGTYYAGAATQLDEVLKLCAQVEPEFIARTADLVSPSGRHEGYAGAALRGAGGARRRMVAGGLRAGDR